MPTAEWTVSLDVPAWAADHLAGIPSLADDEARMRARVEPPEDRLFPKRAFRHPAFGVRWWDRPVCRA